VMTLAFTALGATIALIAALGLADFWVFFALLALTFSFFGLVTSNYNALAMEPVGHIAGSGSALFGAVSATGGAILGGLIARAFDGTVLPFALGLALAGGAALVTILWTERGRFASR
jgi:MFS transporter, DHA1 family, multidrug resistance protein